MSSPSDNPTIRAKTSLGVSNTRFEELRQTEFKDIDSERRFWGKILLKKWLFLYLALWAFLTISLTAENDPIRSAALAMVVAFGASTLITLTLGSVLIVHARKQLGMVSAEEKLLATVFLMALFALYPFCWYFKFGWSVALASTLLIYQSLVMLSRHSKFSESLLGEDTPKLFPNTLDTD